MTASRQILAGLCLLTAVAGWLARRCGRPAPRRSGIRLVPQPGHQSQRP